MTTNDDLSDRPGGGVMSWDDPSPYPGGPCCWRARYVRSEGRYRCSVCHPEDEPQAEEAAEELRQQHHAAQRDDETTDDICRELRAAGLDPERMQRRVRRIAEERRAR